MPPEKWRREMDGADRRAIGRAPSYNMADPKYTLGASMLKRYLG